MKQHYTYSKHKKNRSCHHWRGGRGGKRKGKIGIKGTTTIKIGPFPLTVRRCQPYLWGEHTSTDTHAPPNMFMLALPR